MEITTVKIAGEGYLVNGSMSVPKAQGNRHYAMVQEWIAEGGVVDDEFTASEITQASVDKGNSEARAALKETDWYIIRNFETGQAVPANITAERAAHRQNVV